MRKKSRTEQVDRLPREHRRISRRKKMDVSIVSNILFVGDGHESAKTEQLFVDIEPRCRLQQIKAFQIYCWKTTQTGSCQYLQNLPYFDLIGSALYWLQ